ncbi:hypothetical protein [Actinophytocola sp.]|uniref:hypothetical protein n=1 Tax=Actinophytocola sp. TaxID=1872138 RepID=UPI002D5E97B1|nr:hypothetical protein [Actinophytocola sp.]HYQ68040.1 hypothetical protein [Actinophytocola sp.]
MTVGDWSYAPDPGYVDHLDDVFRQGNAPRLAGMLRSLANPSTISPYFTPCYLDIPAVVVVAPDDGEFTSHEVGGSEQIGTDAYSILQGSARSDPQPDLTIEQFFYHADILTGQDVGKLRDHLGTKLDRLDVVDGGYVADVVEALDATRTGETTKIWTDINRVFLTDSTAEGSIWHDWTGTAAAEAKPKFVTLGKWFAQDASDGEFRQRALRDLSEILIRYAATIHGARMNLDNLMGELVDQVHAWNDNIDIAKEHPGNWISLSGIKDLKSKTPIGVAFSVADAMMAAAAETTNAKQLPENQVYFKLASFLKAADQLLWDTANQVNALTGDLDRVRDGRERVDIPVWPS